MIALQSKKALGRLIIPSIIFASLAFVFAFYSVKNVDALTYTTIGSQLDVGARGTDVTNLQRFLASNPTIYPEGVVSGYYGPLTAQAVAQFQFQYNLPQVGRVGPMTLGVLNSLILADRGMDISAPKISTVNVLTSSTSATFNWSTDEFATAKVYYSTIPLQKSDTDRNFSAPYVSGTVAPQDGVLRTGQSITIQNLAPSTTYYYLIQATDQAGNVSVSWDTFRTS